MGNGGGSLVWSLQKILHTSWNNASFPGLRNQRFSDSRNWESEKIGPLSNGHSSPSLPHMYLFLPTLQNSADRLEAQIIKLMDAGNFLHSSIILLMEAHEAKGCILRPQPAHRYRYLLTYLQRCIKHTVRLTRGDLPKFLSQENNEWHSSNSVWLADYTEYWGMVTHIVLLNRKAKDLCDGR